VIGGGEDEGEVCTVVTHELAHMWFGNLVTMEVRVRVRVTVRVRVSVRVSARIRVRVVLCARWSPIVR